MKNILAISSEECAQELRHAAVPAIAEIRLTLQKHARGEVAEIYNILRYHMGFVDAHFKSTGEASGKHLRAGLSMLLARAYGVQKQSLDAVVAIELFHNATLLHDDIEDRDETRRGKLTVWKLWGINKAINAGDMQSVLVADYIARAGRVKKVGSRLSDALLTACMEVWEGQHLDFDLATTSLGSPIATEKNMLLMLKKKTGTLMRVSAEIAGIVGKKHVRELQRLREFGMSLGIAFQIADDIHSVWGSNTATGKDIHGDIREHKRTLPILRTYEQLTHRDKEELKQLYSSERQLTDDEIREVQEFIDTTDAREYSSSQAKLYAARAKNAASKLSIPKQTQALLYGIVDMLVGDVVQK